ncbi:hypothetical protein B0H16DRAFT_1500831 [Mycena metata]|uniref:Secreted protein n=1 Tax=Mycena metata TaxID=1033252 RepID=A0AAD7NXI4_9AGAR|nr:hypothetical protein B0H16DRAFT_1500831 [Mycena metata]
MAASRLLFTTYPWLLTFAVSHIEAAITTSGLRKLATGSSTIAPGTLCTRLNFLWRCSDLRRKARVESFNFLVLVLFARESTRCECESRQGC